METFKDFFACKIVLAANHHHPENIQRLFPLQNCLRRKSSLSWKYSKTFFVCKIVLAANHLYPDNFQRLFRWQNCLRRKSSLSWKYSKTFSPAKMSSTQIIFILKLFKNFFACKIVLDANHHYPEITQRIYCLQNCLISKSSLSWMYSKTFSPANWSYLQIILILKLFKDFYACKNVLAANHHYPENFQGLFRLQMCLRSKSWLTWKYSKTFRLQNCLSRKSSISWKHSKTFSLAKLS